jgi:hypothetical protein
MQALANCNELLRSATVGIVICFFVVLAFVRDSGFGGPHHDEVIGLLAAGSKEGSYARMLVEDSAPLNVEVSASEWHAFTHCNGPVSFADIRWDVMHGDKHPPLAFWLMNRWLNLFDDGGYSEAVLLIMLQVLLAAIILGFVVCRYTSDWNYVVLAVSLFLLGNSAVFTAVWVRQYGLFVICYAALVAVSGELVRERLSLKQNIILLCGLAFCCLAGMMTQYTFATMSLPIHLMLLGVLIARRNWRQLGFVLSSYIAAGLLFFWLMPGAIEHATAVSGGQKIESQLVEALTGLPRMLIPMPSALPVSLKVVGGSMALLLPLLLAVLACRSGAWTRDRTRPDARVPLAGMLGAGILQFVMVAVGLFPGWATSENHMCSFWLLTVFALILCLQRWSSRLLKPASVGLLLTGMIGMQVLFTWHCHRILPRVNTSYIQSQPHDLVAIDNLARGFVLQITDLVPANEKVLATDSEKLASRLADGSLRAYQRVLYLPMDSSVREGKPTVLAAAKMAGWQIEAMPVVHPTVYEAYIIRRSP